MNLYQNPELYDLLDTHHLDDLDFYIQEALKANRKCLELASGTGNVSIPIAQAGVEVVGVEKSPQMLAVALEKVRTLPKDVQERIHFLQGDMRSFELETKFSLIIIPFEGFLHLMTIEDQIATLAAVKRHLLPTGKLILDFNAGHFHVKHTPGKFSELSFWTSVPHPENSTTLEVWARVETDFFEQKANLYRVVKELDKDGSVLRETPLDLESKLIFASEFEHLVFRCGFKVQHLYGSFERVPASEETRKLIWVLAPAS